MDGYGRGNVNVGMEPFTQRWEMKGRGQLKNRNLVNNDSMVSGD